jgi:uncharacterized protein involved in type VI secretion and phage assembly
MSALDFLSFMNPPRDPQLGGVAVGIVLDNMDALSQGRVQVQLPGLPIEPPWARVAVPDAGSDRGTFFMPQVDDEVLVCFEHGDVTRPYVIGSLWNGTDTPPASAPTDPRFKRIIKTPQGHVIELDDTKQTITITSSTKQKIEITQDKIELSAGSGASKLTLNTDGSVTLSAQTTMTLEAQSLKLSATSIDIDAQGTAKLSSSGACTIQGSIVKVN